MSNAKVKEEPVTRKARQVGTITTKLLGIKLEKAKSIKVPLFRVIGVATGVEERSTSVGVSSKFVGQFEVIVYETGEIIEGFNIYLPGIAEDMVNAALTKGSSLSFVLEIGAEPAPTTARGYAWTAEPLVDLDTTSIISDFKSTLNLPPVPAPTVVTV